jgi:hypothetical protein
LHVPLLQVSPAGQTLPQVPQLLTSVAVLVHAAPQKFGVAVGQQLDPEGTSPLGQAQVPLWQLSGAVQVAPQAPQLALSVPSLTHTPAQFRVGSGQIVVPPPSQLMRPVIEVYCAPKHTL